MSYTKTTWENLPSTNTPINATNLNKIENGIYDNSNSIDALIEYSTQETVIGKWINGKPIYRAYITGNVGTSSASGIIYQTVLSNVDEIISWNGRVTLGNIKFVMPMATLSSSVSASASRLIVLNDNSVRFDISDNYSGASYWLCVEYTKTTDTASL